MVVCYLPFGGPPGNSFDGILVVEYEIVARPRPAVNSDSQVAALPTELNSNVRQQPLAHAYSIDPDTLVARDLEMND